MFKEARFIFQAGDGAETVTVDSERESVDSASDSIKIERAAGMGADVARDIAAAPSENSDAKELERAEQLLTSMLLVKDVKGVPLDPKDRESIRNVLSAVQDATPTTKENVRRMAAVLNTARELITSNALLRAIDDEAAIAREQAVNVQLSKELRDMGGEYVDLIRR